MDEAFFPINHVFFRDTFMIKGVTVFLFFKFRGDIRGIITSVIDLESVQSHVGTNF